MTALKALKFMAIQFTVCQNTTMHSHNSSIHAIPFLSIQSLRVCVRQSATRSWKDARMPKHVQTLQIYAEAEDPRSMFASLCGDRLDTKPNG